MTAFWWTVAIAACVGLYFAVRARATGRGDSDVPSDVSAEIAQRADEQNRWAQRGDPRCVYGVEGAELMGRVAPAPDIGAELGRPADFPRTAAVAYTAADLHTLLAEKLPCWRWAAFASVLVQRERQCSRGCAMLNSGTARRAASVRTAAHRWVASWWTAWMRCWCWSIRWRASC